MSEALYKAVKSGRVKLEDLNESGKAALKSYMSGKQTSAPVSQPKPAHSKPMGSELMPAFDVRKSELVQKSKETVAKSETAGKSKSWQDDPSRDLPVIGPILKGLDWVANTPVAEKISDIGQAFYTPGAGVSAVNALTRGAEGFVAKTLAKKIPNLVTTTAGRAASKALSEGAVGVPLGVAGAQVVNPDATMEDYIKGALFGGAAGGAIGAAGVGLGSLGRKAINDIKGPVDREAAIEGFRTTNQRLDDFYNEMAAKYGEGNTKRWSMSDNMRFRSIDQDLDNSVSNLKKFNVTDDELFSRPQSAQGPILALPPGRRDVRMEAARNRGAMPGNETVIPASDIPANALPAGNYQRPQRLRVNNNNETLDYVMRQIKDDVQQDMRDIPIYNKAVEAAAKRGYDLPKLLEGQGQKVADKVTRNAQERVAGVYPTEAPNIARPSSFNKQVVSEAAPIVTRVGARPSGSNPKVTITEPQRRFAPTGEKATPAPSVPPVRKVTTQVVNNPSAPQQGIRANYQNQLNNGNFSPELKRSIRNTDQTYEVKRNADTVAKANENVKNLSQAEARFLANESGGSEHIATGYRLMQELDAVGEYEKALVIANKLAADLTKSGQTSQAASILSRLSPEGQLLNLVRTAERNGKTVSTADSIKFKNLARQVQKKSGAGVRANEFNAILNRLERGENVTVDEVKKLSKFLSGAEDVVKPQKSTIIKDEIPAELKEPRKRDRVISFLDDAEQAALARIQARKNRLNSLPIDEWKDHAIVVAAQIAKGTIKAATHVEDLVRMFGDEIRPVATQVFQRAQKLMGTVSKGAAEGNLDKATEALRRLSGAAQAERAMVEETANHVRKLIADAKDGKLDPADIQKFRDYSDEIAELLDSNPRPRRVPTQEERFLQQVKSLAKKIAQAEDEKMPTDQANREISSLIRQITKIADEGKQPVEKQPLDNKAISDIAHDVMEKTRPNPKPTTLQEKIVEKYIKENGNVSPKDIDTLRQLAKDVTRLSGDQRLEADIAMQKILNSYEKSSAWDKVQALRYIGMLLNTHTQAINALSGPIMTNTGLVADLFGTMLDITMNKVLKTPRTTTLYGTNPLRFIAGYIKNLKIGGKAGAQGVNPAGIQGTNEIRGLAFKSLYNPFGLAERALGAVAKGPDFATYKTVFDSEIRKQGFLSAKNQGIKGKANIENHVREFVNDPPEEAILQADRIGKNTTFQRSDTTGGKVANYLNSAPALVKPGVNAIFPFVRTPINIASTAVTMTPAGIIKGLFQLTSKSDASRREAIRTLSLGVTGTGIGVLGYYLSQLGIITGANDSGDKNVDNVREQAGKGKYRFNTSALSRYLGAMVNGEGPEAAEKAAQYQKGDKQFDYNKLQPLAFPLAIGAGVNDNKEKDIAGQAAGAGADAFGSLFGMSTLKGVQNVFQPSYGGTQGEKALGVPSRIAESFFKSFSQGGIAQEARRQDPIQRKTPFNDGIVKNTTDYFKSRIPGLSQSLPARKTTLGQDYKNAPGFTGSYLNPYRSEVAPYNEAAVIISNLIDRTGDKTLAPSAPDKTVRGTDRSGKAVSIAIPPDRYAQYQEDVGNQIIQRINAIPKGLSDAKMAQKIKDIYSMVNEKERNKIKRELGIRVQN